MRKKQNTEQEALSSLLKGEEEGLDFFFNHYYAPLTYFAFKLLQDQNLAEEISSEAFVKLWNQKEKLQSYGSIKSWLYSTVKNASIDHLRKAKRLRINQSGLQTVETTEQSVLHHMIETEMIQQIMQILKVLPPKCSQVFQMFFLQGKSYEEIAREMNISPHTARNQKIRAIRLIKSKMIFLFILVLSKGALLLLFSYP